MSRVRSQWFCWRRFQEPGSKSLQGKTTYPRPRKIVNVNHGLSVPPREPSEAPLLLLIGRATAPRVKPCGIGHRDLEDLGRGQVAVPPVACRVRQTDCRLVPYDLCVSRIYPLSSRGATIEDMYVCMQIFWSKRRSTHKRKAAARRAAKRL